MQATRSHFLHELRSIALYLAVLAGLGYGTFALISGGQFISMLAAADQRLEWLMPKRAANPAETFHPSLKPRLRGAVSD